MAKHFAQTFKEAHMMAKIGQRVITAADPESEEIWGEEAVRTAGWYSTLQACTPRYFNGEGELLNNTNKIKEEMLRWLEWVPGVPVQSISEQVGGLRS
jgi:hypothetical protein